MKKVILFVLVILAYSQESFSQEKYSTFYSSFIEKELELLIKHNDPKFSLYVEGFSLTRLTADGGIIVNEKSHVGFYNNLLEAKNKYIEWRQVALENNVNDLKKKVEIKTQPVSGYFKRGSQYYFNHSIRPTFNFVISNANDELKYLMIINTGKIQASTNRYIDSDGFVIILSSEQEFDELLELVSMERIIQHKNKSSGKDDLFKN